MNDAAHTTAPAFVSDDGISGLETTRLLRLKRYRRALVWFSRLTTEPETIRLHLVQGAMTLFLDVSAAEFFDLESLIRGAADQIRADQAAAEAAAAGQGEMFEALADAGQAVPA